MLTLPTQPFVLCFLPVLWRGILIYSIARRKKERKWLASLQIQTYASHMSCNVTVLRSDRRRWQVAAVKVVMTILPRLFVLIVYRLLPSVCRLSSNKHYLSLGITLSSDCVIAIVIIHSDLDKEFKGPLWLGSGQIVRLECWHVAETDRGTGRERDG